MAAELLGEGEVDGVARHLVAVRHACVVVIAGGTLAAAYTYDALADAVVKQGNIEL